MKSMGEEYDDEPWMSRFVLEVLVADIGLRSFCTVWKLRMSWGISHR